jgi:aryl-alcohol dehydrogenase-like predicted oxidoreductase
MQYRQLGRTGIEVSRIALGCGTFGGIGSPAALIGRGLDEAAAFATMDEAMALGITLFDTAFSYAGGASDRSERRRPGTGLGHDPPAGDRADCGAFYLSHWIHA